MRKIFVVVLVVVGFVAQALPTMAYTEVRNRSGQPIVAVFTQKREDKVVVIQPGQKYNVPSLTSVQVVYGDKVYNLEPKEAMKKGIEVVGNGELGCLVFPIGQGSPYIWTTN